MVSEKRKLLHSSVEVPGSYSSFGGGLSAWVTIQPEGVSVVLLVLGHRVWVSVFERIPCYQVDYGTHGCNAEFRTVMV